MIHKNILVVGHVAKDVVTRGRGTKTFWGGSGYHVAMAAASVNPDVLVYLDTIVGMDFDIDVLEKQKVKTDMIVVQSQNTDVHYLNETGFKREYYSVGNLCESVDIKISANIVDSIGWVHLSSAPPKQQLRWLSQIKKIFPKNVKISCDSFESFTRDEPGEVIKVFRQCHWVFVNQIEWADVDIQKVKSNIVRKLGEDGAELYIKNKLVNKVDAPKIKKVVDTTGAGDVVAGVFVVSKVAGHTNLESLTVACKLATKSVGDLGTNNLIVK